MSFVSKGIFISEDVFFFFLSFFKDSVLLLTVFICGVCEYVTTFSYKLIVCVNKLWSSHYCHFLDQNTKYQRSDT